MFLMALVPAVLAFLVMGGHFVMPDGGLTLKGLTDLDSGLATQLQPQRISVTLACAAIALIWTILSSAVIDSAIYRTTWERASPRVGGLRLGGAELWLSLVICCQLSAALILIYAANWIVLAVLLIGAIVGPPYGGPVILISAGVLSALCVWLLLRLCLAQPMTVAQARFRLFESWTLTRGRAWKLFWTAGLMLALRAGLEALYLKALLVSLQVIAGAWSVAELEPSPLVMIPLGLLWLAFASFVGALLRTLISAPFAAVYRGLSGEV